MRVVVTGAMNPTGQAIVRTLAAAGHAVRAFGVPLGQDPFADLENVQSHAGEIQVVGSIEPVLSQRDALVHAACLDAPGKDKRAHAFVIERGTLSARYGAEREMVDHFIHVTPADPERAYRKAVEAALGHVRRTRGPVNTRIIVAADPQNTAREVVEALQEMPELGYLPGADDAVTA